MTDANNNRHLDLWDVMRALYRSEINCGMASFWDAGFTVWLGDELNGKQAERQFFDEHFDFAADWLRDEAIKHFPESAFALGSTHTHVAGEGDNRDACRECGRDIRDPIHRRVTRA